MLKTMSTAMQNILNLKGQQLEKAFEKLIKEQLKLENYYPNSGQIQLVDLNPNVAKGEHLEIDGVLLLNRMAILMEFTGQIAEKQRKKINRFTRSCNIFIQANKSKREKFRLFNSIPERMLSDFEEVNDWKFAFFGTSEEIDNKQLTPAHFPDYPTIQRALSIFGCQDIEYISQLCDLINEYAKYEFLSALKVPPTSLGEEQRIEKKFIRVDNRYVTESDDIKADIFLLNFKVEELLKIGRVSRYEGIPFMLESEENSQYQRFLVKSKLKSIARDFVKNEKRRIFPNTVTLVLANDCTIDQNDKSILLIPNRYSSIDIIDGQHRIYAYADQSISKKVRSNAVIVASAIKFQTNKQEEIKRNAARVFCEINSKQAKVKNSLLYLIKYDVLGDKDAIALAGKVILECNRGKSVLGNLFLVNSLVKKNKFNMSPIPIVTIVNEGLRKLFEGEGLEYDLVEPDGYEAVFDHPRDYLLNHPEKWWKKCKSILEFYFNHVKATFPDDFKENSNSNLLSAKYISAFIRLLRYYLIDEGIELSKVPARLKLVKSRINKIAKPSTGEASFARTTDSLPSTKYGIGTIFNFLKDPSHNWKNDE